MAMTTIDQTDTALDRFIVDDPDRARGYSADRCAFDEVQDILGMAEQVTSLDTPIDGDPQSSLLDMLADATETGPDAHAEQREMVLMVRRWLDSIPVKQRLVIMRRYGLDHGHPATLEELADEMGVTRERVRQIQQEGLHRLKRAMTAKGVGKDALL